MVIAVSALLSLLFAAIVMAVEYWSKKIDVRHKRYIEKLISFSAGVSITYALLGLLPFFAETALAIDKLLFFSLVFGFAIHHIVEKKIYQYNHRFQLLKVISLEENIFYYIYHFILGIVLVTLTQQDMTAGILLFVSIIFYTIIHNLPQESYKNKLKALFLSTSTLVGAIFAVFIWTQRALWIEFSLIGMATGVVLFTVTRHHLPFGRKGDVRYFILGVISYTALLILKGYV
ncbi:MAG: hypothetical protein Q8R37_03490 [Nanoarchaeota archaeon]|nr:hypothetical protein [Nanoarchaeota archaeon]